MAAAAPASSSSSSRPRGVVVRGETRSPGFAEILSGPALTFVAALHRRFDERRLGLLALRERRQAALDAGGSLHFPKHTKHIRDGHWKAARAPPDLQDRRVEITGPVDRKMVINALNSGAKVFMADFEDSSAATWDQMISGQVNLRDANLRNCVYVNPKNGKKYALNSDEKKLATLMVRPRGWHLDEAHILVDGRPVSGSLVDFGLYFFHNARVNIDRGSGPYFYLAKLESHLEARLWNDVFVFAQNYCDVPRGTIRATVLLETIMGAFEMDELIFELREHSAGLNCGRWDYLFSFIKKFRSRADLVLPDRAQVGMNKPFMSNYVERVIQVCHRRGVHAMGGMAAQIPVKNDAKANAAAFEKVRADKEREVRAGHDGTWVAHPALIPVAMKEFDKYMPEANQVEKPRIGARTITEADLLDTGDKGTITEQGLRDNLSVGLLYLEAWLRGVGCVPLNNLMEDAATAEISRSQVWQWIQHGAIVTMKNGTKRPITKQLVQQLFDEEVGAIRDALGASAFAKRPFGRATEIYTKMLFSKQLAEWLTSEAYPYVTRFVDGGRTAKL